MRRSMMENLSYDCSDLTIDVLSKKMDVNINRMSNVVDMINGKPYAAKSIEMGLKIPKRLQFTSNYVNPETLEIEKGDYPTTKLLDHFQNIAAASEDKIVKHVFKNIPDDLYTNGTLKLYKITAYCMQTSTNSYTIGVRLRAGILSQ